MKIATPEEAANTRTKLELLEKEYEAAKLRPMATEELHQLTLYSLRHMINQLKEELTRFEWETRSSRRAS